MQGVTDRLVLNHGLALMGKHLAHNEKEKLLIKLLVLWSGFCREPGFKDLGILRMT